MAYFFKMRSGEPLIGTLAVGSNCGVLLLWRLPEQLVDRVDRRIVGFARLRFLRFRGVETLFRGVHWALQFISPLLRSLVLGFEPLIVLLRLFHRVLGLLQLAVGGTCLLLPL